ncbi:MAG: hypothetical protein LW832_07620 [Parachlamydia sp.]|jgi:hypothetical protein|nr:hypothetical protein [Parachlamydia sp.]
MDIVKEIVELSLQAGRSFKSSQTGFVHYCHQLPVPQFHQSVPLYENFLFALSLFRSKLVDNIQEAKELLAKLLHYQNDKGNLPYYLHDYPVGQEPYLAVRLLPPLIYMERDFGHVMGKELKDRVNTAIHSLMSFTKEAHEKGAFPDSAAVLLGACRHVRGEEVRAELLGRKECWHATAFLAELMVAAQLMGANDPAWEEFFKHLSSTWHPTIGSYCGPCIREWQEKDEPQPVFYDLWMGALMGRLPKRLRQPGIYHLQGALIQPGLFSLPERPLNQSGAYQGEKWSIAGTGDWSWAALEKKQKYSPIIEKTYTPFRLIAGHLDKIQSFVCQGGRAEAVHYVANPDYSKIELDFLFDEDPGREREKTRDICFFWNDHPDWPLLVEGHPSTVFEIGQTVSIQLKDALTLRLQFLVEGEADWIGHMAKGNRPSQVKALGEQRFFESYDRILFLRCIRQSGACRVKAFLQVC